MKHFSRWLFCLSVAISFAACGGSDKKPVSCDEYGCDLVEDEIYANCLCEIDGRRVKNCEDANEYFICPADLTLQDPNLPNLAIDEDYSNNDFTNEQGDDHENE